MSEFVTGVCHTGVTISDMDRALAFFGECLGATTTEPVLYTDAIFERVTGVAGANIRIAYVQFPGHQLELLEYVKPEDRKVTPSRPCDPGHLHLSLNVKNIDSLVKKMSRFGFEAVGPVQDVPGDTPFRVIYTYGFDGLVIELMDFTK